MEEVIVATEAIEDEQEAMPKILRLFKGFEMIDEKPFWPDEVNESADMLMTPTTFLQLATNFNDETYRKVEKIEKTMRSYKNEYTNYINEVERTPNVFSFETDYI